MNRLVFRAAFFALATVCAYRSTEAAEAAETITVLKRFPAGAVVDSKVHRVVVTADQVRSWKSDVVYHLTSDDVRNVLSTPQGSEYLAETARRIQGASPDEAANIFMSRAGDLISSSGGEMRLGLLDSIGFDQRKVQAGSDEPCLVEFVLPREEVRAALKEIIYAVGYLDGLPEFMSAVLNTAQAGSARRAVVNGLVRSVSQRLPEASRVAAAGAVEKVRENPDLIALDDKIDRLLDAGMNDWMTLVCGSTAR